MPLLRPTQGLVLLTVRIHAVGEIDAPQCSFPLFGVLMCSHSGWGVVFGPESTCGALTPCVLLLTPPRPFGLLVHHPPAVAEHGDGVMVDFQDVVSDPVAGRGAGIEVRPLQLRVSEASDGVVLLPRCSSTELGRAVIRCVVHEYHVPVQAAFEVFEQALVQRHPLNAVPGHPVCTSRSIIETGNGPINLSQ